MRRPPLGRAGAVLAVSAGRDGNLPSRMAIRQLGECCNLENPNATPPPIAFLRALDIFPSHQHAYQLNGGSIAAFFQRQDILTPASPDGTCQTLSPIHLSGLQDIVPHYPPRFSAACSELDSVTSPVISPPSPVHEEPLRLAVPALPWPSFLPPRAALRPPPRQPSATLAIHFARRAARCPRVPPALQA
jgi:hypothetical protein